MDLRNQYKEQAVCPKCGSFYFQRAEFRRYRGGMTSSAPGGDLSPISGPLTARICICGHPDPDVPRVTILPEERRRFKQSVAAALTYGQLRDSRRIASELPQSFATRDELEALTERLEQLNLIINIARKERRPA